MANLPSFWVGTSANYNALTTKDPNALYFLTDTQQIVRGTTKFSQDVQFVESLPVSGVRGVIYYVNTTGVASVWNGSNWKQIGVTTVSDITAEGVKATDVPNVTALNAALSAANSNITDAYTAAISAGDSAVTDAYTSAISAAVTNVTSAYTDAISAGDSAVTSAYTDAISAASSALSTDITNASSAVTSAYTAAISTASSALSSAIDTKVDKVDGYQLMSADESTKLATYPAAYSEVTSTMDTKISAAIASAFKYKGTKADMAELEAVTGMVTGDVWHVTSGANGTSAEYVYNGTAWEELGTIVDMSGFATKVSGGTSGNVATLDAEGNLIDGGANVGGSALAATATATTLATELAVKTYADNVASAAQSAATAVANSAQSAADAAQSAADSAQSAADAAQTTADGKIAKIASAAGGKVALTTSAGELTESEFTVGGAALEVNPSSNVLATEAAVYTALQNANAVVNSGKMDKVGGAVANEVLLTDANGQAILSGKTIGGSAFASSGNANLLATEAGVQAAIADVVSSLEWQTIPSAE